MTTPENERPTTPQPLASVRLPLEGLTVGTLRWFLSLAAASSMGDEEPVFVYYDSPDTTEYGPDGLELQLSVGELRAVTGERT